MNAGFRANPAFLCYEVEHRPIRCEWHGQGSDDVDQLTKRQNRRQSFGDRRHKCQRISLLDEGALPTLLSAFPFGNFNPQLVVRPLELDRALLHMSVQFVVRTPQGLLVLAERSLGNDPLGDVDGVAEDVWKIPRLFVQHITVHPHTGPPVAGDHTHQPGILPIVTNALEVAIEKMACLGGKKFGQIATNPVLGLIPERARRSRIDRQQTTVQIVRADETQTVLNEVAVAPLALFERLLRLLPGCGDVVKRSVLRIADMRWRAPVRVT